MKNPKLIAAVEYTHIMKIHPKSRETRVFSSQTTPLIARRPICAEFEPENKKKELRAHMALVTRSEEPRAHMV